MIHAPNPLIALGVGASTAAVYVFFTGGCRASPPQAPGRKLLAL